MRILCSLNNIEKVQTGLTSYDRRIEKIKSHFRDPFSIPKQKIKKENFLGEFISVDQAL